ncbi:hypothetical protein HPB47_012481, partial [Ixodes persulcatus]
TVTTDGQHEASNRSTESSSTEQRAVIRRFARRGGGQRPKQASKGHRRADGLESTGSD